MGGIGGRETFSPTRVDWNPRFSIYPSHSFCLLFSRSFFWEITRFYHVSDQSHSGFPTTGFPIRKKDNMYLDKYIFICELLLVVMLIIVNYYWNFVYESHVNFRYKKFICHDPWSVSYKSVRKWWMQWNLCNGIPFFWKAWTDYHGQESDKIVLGLASSGSVVGFLFTLHPRNLVGSENLDLLEELFTWE